MSKERELLQRCLDEFEYKGVACNELCIDINKLLAQPEQDNIQYLLDQVARLTAENAMLKEKWSTPKPEQDQEPLLAETKIEWYGKGFRQGVNEFAPPKPLTEDVIYALDKEGVVENMDDHQVRYVIRWIRRVEKAHGIGGGNE